MMFIVRSAGERPDAAGIRIKLSRKTPAIVPDAAGKTDFFCVGEAEAIAALRAAGWNIVDLHDGYYEDGAWAAGSASGARANTGRSATPRSPSRKRSGRPDRPKPAPPRASTVNVRGAIFGV